LFKICARTVLALGAELISSDIVAFYELIKNSFDAKSPNGAEIFFEIVLRRNDYLIFRERASDKNVNINQLKVDVCEALNSSAPKDSLERSQIAINQVTRLDSFIRVLDEIYDQENRIIVSDNGTGMSKQDLINNYLIIGTSSRKRAIDAALSDPAYDEEHPPYLGEKGIGRLSAMRLGNFLSVETAKKSDAFFNILRIDWSAFDNLNTTLDNVKIIPEQGEIKPTSNWSGTRLIIKSLAADWTKDRVKYLCKYEFSRLTDPFIDTKRRPTIAVYWNEERVSVARMDKALLEHAHASVKGQYTIQKNRPHLKCTFEALNLGFDHPYVEEDLEISGSDIEGLISGTSKQILPSVLRNLGEFKFEAYWFNRKRLSSIESIGNLKDVRDLQSRWSGILIFRDGFRVFPYGEDDDDWLAMDRRALSSSGYLLNKTQFVGRVAITRIKNSKLVDQTNRQGLRVCPEQQVFMDLLQDAIQSRLRNFLFEVQKRYKVSISNLSQMTTDVSALEERAEKSLNQIRHLAPEFDDIINELDSVFDETKKSFSKTESQLRLQLSEAKVENRQMIQMAGVGLLVEVVAHELARSAENALATLKILHHKDAPDQIRRLLSVLQSEMNAVSKRLRVLDPLSISGRQRKERFMLDHLIQDIFSSHEMQFKRHSVTPILTMSNPRVRIYAVKGMIVQIIENLISNSLYWLDIRKQEEPELLAQIRISIESTPLTITYEDNGSGIAQGNHEIIFRPFFSLKEKSKRRGLGLYIARECAEYHDGSLQLDGEVNLETGRLHRFIIELPREATAS